MTEKNTVQKNLEQNRRRLSEEERAAFIDSVKALLMPIRLDRYKPMPVPISSTLRGTDFQHEIIPEQTSSSYLINDDVEATLRSIPKDLSDIFNPSSDPEIVATIQEQLRRSPYAEFSALHFPGGTEGREITVQSDNPYLNPLIHHAARFGYRTSDHTYSARYWLNIESKPIPQLREVTPTFLRAYRIGQRTMVSAYDSFNEILTAWRPIESLSLNYSEQGDANAPTDPEKLFDISVHQPQISFESAQVDPLIAALERQREESKQPNFPVFPEFENCRFGPKTVLYRKIGTKSLQELVVPVQYGWDEVDVSANHNKVIKPDAIVEHAGTVWIQDNELDIEVPYRRDSTIKKHRSTLDSDLKLHLEPGLTNRDDRFIQWVPVGIGDGHP